MFPNLCWKTQSFKYLKWINVITCQRRTWSEAWFFQSGHCYIYINPPRYPVNWHSGSFLFFFLSSVCVSLLLQYLMSLFFTLSLHVIMTELFIMINILPGKGQSKANLDWACPNLSSCESFKNEGHVAVGVVVKPDQDACILYLDASI